jgi:hypothetical protein
VFGSNVKRSLSEEILCIDISIKVSMKVTKKNSSTKQLLPVYCSKE